MKIYPTIAAAFTVLVAGCATSYQPSGATGGFSETRLAPDIVRVVFRGNGYTQKDRAQDFALLRASELSLAAGFPYFTVLTEDNDVKSQAISTGGTAQTVGTAQTIGNRTVYSGSTVYTPGQTILIRRPESGLLVKFLREKQDGILVFNSAFIITSIKQKYKLP